MQVLCRHDAAFAPSVHLPLLQLCAVGWCERELDISTENSLRVCVPNTPTPLWLAMNPPSADYLCTCTWKRFKNIAASLLRPTKRCSPSRLDAVVTAAMRAFTRSGVDCEPFQSMNTSNLASWRAESWSCNSHLKYALKYT